MKKIFVILSVLLLVVGCNNDKTSDKNEKDDKVEESLTVEEYYDIVIETIESDSTGTIEGEYVGGLLQAGGKTYDYSGEINSGIASISGETATTLTSDFESEIDIKNPSEDDDYTLGLTSIYDVDTSSCNVEGTTVECFYEEITESENESEYYSDPEQYSNSQYEGKRMEYVFSFNEKDELESIQIKYVKVTDFIESIGLGENPDLDVEETILSYFDNPSMKFFMDIPLNGIAEFTVDTITYQ